jgi:hypothetical protein
MSTHTCPICITSTGIERPNEDGGYIALPPAALRAQVVRGAGRLAAPWCCDPRSRSNCSSGAESDPRGVFSLAPFPPRVFVLLPDVADNSHITASRNGLGANQTEEGRHSFAHPGSAFPPRQVNAGRRPQRAGTGGGYSPREEGG